PDRVVRGIPEGGGPDGAGAGDGGSGCDDSGRAGGGAGGREPGAAARGGERALRGIRQERSVGGRDGATDAGQARGERLSAAGAHRRGRGRTGVRTPSGIAFLGDPLDFAQETAVKRLDPGPATPVTVVSGLPPGGHSPRTIAFGPDNLMYVAVGSSCNVCDDPPPRAAVTRYNLDGSGAHTFATGLRNSVGLAFNPGSGELWANNNDRDYLGDDLPPEHLNILQDGKWYGWPQCYLPNQPNPEYSGANCSNVEPPALTVQAHSAPLGLTFYTGTKFPAEYQGDA